MLTSRHAWFPVRDPNILGFLRLMLDTDGSPIPIAKSRDGRQHHVNVAQFSELVPYIFGPAEFVSALPQVVRAEHAIMSAGKPTDYWRSMDGFIEKADPARDTQSCPGICMSIRAAPSPARPKIHRVGADSASPSTQPPSALVTVGDLVAALLRFPQDMAVYVDDVADTDDLHPPNPRFDAARVVAGQVCREHNTGEGHQVVVL